MFEPKLCVVLSLADRAQLTDIVANGNTPQKLAVRCELNGKVMQDGTTADMIFDVKTIIAHLSQAFTLYPGDIILTGTPNGVGFT